VRHSPKLRVRVVRPIRFCDRSLDQHERIVAGETSGELKRSSVMLVLSRQRDESIIIGDHIVITVVDIRGDKVRLGIEAPKEVPVHRQEVYEAIQRENALKTNAPKDELPAEKKS
jgi:carbon storage regulator